MTKPVRGLRRFGVSRFNFTLLILIAGFLLLSVVAFYGATKNGDMEWLRTRIENSVNERANGAFTIKIGSAHIAARDGGDTRLYLGGVFLEGKDQQFSIAGRELALKPKWFSVLSGTIQIKSAAFSDGYVNLRLPEGKARTRQDLIAGEKLLSELEQSAAEGADIADKFEFVESDSISDIIDAEDANRPSDTQTAEIAAGGENEAKKREGTPEILELVGANLLRTSNILTDFQKFGLGDVSLNNIHMEVTDENNNPWRDIFITSARMTESEAAGGIGQQHDIAIETQQRGAEGAGLTISHINRADSDKRGFVFEISNFIARNFIERLNLPGYPIVVPVVFSSQGQIVIDDAGKVDQFRMSSSAGSGLLETGPKAAFHLDSADLHLSYHKREQIISIEPSPFVFGKNEIITQGTIELPLKLTDPYHYEFVALDSYFDAPDANAEPVVVERIVARGAMQPKHKVLSVSSFELNAGDVEFNAAVTFGFEKRTPSMALAAESSDVPVGVLKQLWPIFIAPTARKWTLDNVNSGIVTGGTVRTALPGGVLGRLRKGATMEDDEMQIDFKLTNGSFNTIGEFPSVDDVEAVGQVRGISFTADLKKGSAASLFGRKLALKSGKLHVSDFRFPGPKANISFGLDGDAMDLGEVFNRPPVRALDYAKINPKNINGQSKAQFDITVPLRTNVKKNDVKWEADLELKNFSSKDPIDGRKVEKATASIQMNPKFILVKGRGVIDDIAADIDLKRPLDGKGIEGTLAVNVVLSDKDREKLGIDLEDYLIGPISVAIEQSNDPKGDLYKIDLSTAELRLDFIGWRKAKGIPATAEMRFTSDDNGTKVRDFVLKGEGFGARGDIDLKPEGEIAKLFLKNVALKAGDNLTISGVLKSERTYDLEVSGAAFDARSLIKVITSVPSEVVEEKDRYRYKIRADISQLTGYLNETINNLSIDVSMRSTTPLRLKASGYTKGHTVPFAITYGAVGKRGDVLVANGPNAGALARFANIYYRAYGGNFRLSAARPPGSTAMVGHFVMNNFALVDEPALGGLTNTTNKQGQSVVKFNVFDVKFTEENQRLITRKGLLSGENVGGTYEGILNRRTKAIDVTGTYVPAYVINNFISKIPIVGLALGNGQREGLIGVTFKIGGTLGRPEVKINPLSALAPGFLRQLFRFKKVHKNIN